MTYLLSIISSHFICLELCIIVRIAFKEIGAKGEVVAMFLIASGKTVSRDIKSQEIKFRENKIGAKSKAFLLLLPFILAASMILLPTGAWAEDPESTPSINLWANDYPTRATAVTSTLTLLSSEIGRAHV